MFIAEQQNFVFVHIPKTGGLSVGRRLMAHVPGLRSGLDGMAPDNLEDFHHPLARDIRHQIGAAWWGRSFSFSFVRNPWDRLVSWHSMARQTAARTPVLDHMRRLSFADFIAFEPPLRQTGYDQCEWLFDAGGQPIVTFIGRFERLAADFAHVAQIIGVPAALPHMNPSQHTAYQDYYTPATQAIVAKRFARDIAMFDYHF